MRKCRNCNIIMEDGMMFCPECGVRYISFDEQIHASENCSVVIAEQSIFLNDGKVQAVILFGNVGEKTISAFAIRLKCFDAFGTELADTIVKYSDLSEESQAVFGGDKLISPVDSDTRKIYVIVEMVLFEDGTKWNGTAEELKPTNVYDAFKSKIHNYTMTEIWEELFRNKEQLNQMLEVQPDVVLPHGITEIPDHAFELCENLNSITIPDSVTCIGQNAFHGCKKLTNITIPDSVTSIGKWAFGGCTSFTNITIPDSVTCIGQNAFDGCKKLTNITIQDGVTSIGDSAFWGCTSLTKITIPYSVTFIGRFAFADCTSLTNVTITNPMCKMGDYPFSNTPYGKESASKSGGCYIATCVYGSYNCPQVWTLRRYRDNALAETWHGRVFIRAYYAISPTIVKLFGNTKWFHKMWKGKLDKMVSRLQKSGYESTPYEDRKW